MSTYPEHVAIIMDGNGRWAAARSLPRFKGHEEGSKSVREIITACRELDIPHLTLFVFSTENWQRPSLEVKFLMNLLKRYLIKERKLLMDKGIRLLAIGDLERLPNPVQTELAKTMSLTQDNQDMQLTLALSYGGRWDITQAAKQIACDVQAGKLDVDQIDENLFSRYLNTSGIPDPDLLIRSSGESRISNFLLWQLAYTELYITPTLWPDFGRDELLEAFKVYAQRQRRFGKVEPVSDEASPSIDNSAEDLQQSSS